MAKAGGGSEEREQRGLVGRALAPAGLGLPSRICAFAAEHAREQQLDRPGRAPIARLAHSTLHTLQPGVIGLAARLPTFPAAAAALPPPRSKPPQPAMGGGEFSFAVLLVAYALLLRQLLLLMS